jgi:hypothetical protein
MQSQRFAPFSAFRQVPLGHPGVAAESRAEAHGLRAQVVWVADPGGARPSVYWATILTFATPGPIREGIFTQF